MGTLFKFTNKNNEPGDFSNIKFSYTGNKNIIYIDFKKPIN